MTKSLHTPIHEHFRMLMIKAREDSGITQAKLAICLDRPQSFVSKYESGERRIDLIEFIEICVALDADPHKIVSSTLLIANKLNVNGVENE
jgi:transcriptional regulator with XRE-family HTH domain